MYSTRNNQIRNRIGQNIAIDDFNFTPNTPKPTSRRTKINIYKIMIKPVVMYGYENASQTLSGEYPERYMVELKTQ